MPCSLENLCREIRLAEEATEKVLELNGSLDWNALAPGMTMMSTPGRWKEGLGTLKAALAPDENGFKMLTCCLVQALETRKMYASLHIPEEIFIPTFACFSRFVDEHMASFGCYGFDRDFWTVRQLSAKLFRIGELEYELLEEEGEKRVDLHIPSGARLLAPILRQSWLDATSLLARCFPDYADAPMCCDSWMLSPTLGQFLPEKSNIMTFRSAFILTPLEEGNSYMEWVFKRTDLALPDLPEDTSLQRKLKAYLLAGGEWIEALGVLKEDAFKTL